MTEQELREVLKLLEDAGWEPQLCDTPIPVYESVHAGNPEAPSQIPADMALVPKALLSMCPEMMVRVKGNSMIDAGIEDGDVVKMELEASPREGDIVVVAIGSECTVKSYYVDDDGISWLVPQNEQEKELYRVIRLDTEHENVHLCGVVKEIFKALPRVPCRNLRMAVAEAKFKCEETHEITQQQISYAIRMIAKDIDVARLWYAVYRVMVDSNVVTENDYDGFIDMVLTEVPNHKNPPTRTELQRMAVQSFAKPVSSWRINNAPVQGKRYNDYLKIAQKTEKLLLGV